MRSSNGELQGSYVEEGGKPFHEDCLARREQSAARGGGGESAWSLMNETDKNKCSTCGKPVAVGEGLSIKAPFKSSNYTQGRFYVHEGCFRCENCKTQLSGQFVTGENGFFCQPCAAKSRVEPAQADPCTACRKPLVGKLVRALGKAYHSDCFRCASCRGAFPNGEFVDVNGKPTCEKCA